MKKIIALLLSFLLVLLAFPLAVFADGNNLNIDVVSDLHFSAADSSSPIKNSTADEPYGHVQSNGKMLAESRAIITKMLSMMITDNSEYLIITGDLTDNGTSANMETMAEILKDFEESSGKTVLVSIGNHEFFGGNAAAFKKYYAELGYDKAIAVDPDSASYTVDLNDTYRLIQIDAVGFDDERFAWLENQALTAQKDGKKLITTTHYNIFDHYSLQKLAHAEGTFNEKYHLADKMIEWGIRFNFSGHSHALDVSVYTNDNGSIYDMISGSATTYPCCYRTVSFLSDKVYVDTEYIKEIDAALVPEGLNEQAFDLLKSDFRQYSKNMFMVGSAQNIKSYLSVNYIKGALGLTPQNDAQIIDLINIVIPRAYEAVYMPMYGENSLAEYAEKQGTSIENSKYERAIDALCELYAANCAGNEDYPTYSLFGRLAVNILNTAIMYALEPLTEEQYKVLLNWAAAKLDIGIELPEMLIDTLSGSVLTNKDIQSVLVYALTPLINDFSKDKAPDDVKCVLPNYGDSKSEAMSFWDKLVSFFSKIIAFFDSMFSIFSVLSNIFPL